MMDKDLPGQDAPPRRLRRSYSALVFGAPWLLGGTGLSLVAFGLFADRPVTIQVTALTAGVIMAVVGFLALRVSGPLELTPKGVKGNIDAIPADALFLVHDAAQKALPDHYRGDFRNDRADQAAFRALQDFSLIQAATGIIELDDFSRRALQFLATQDSERYMMALTELLDKQAKGKDESYVYLLRLVRQVQQEEKDERDAMLKAAVVSMPPERSIEDLKRDKEFMQEELLSLEAKIKEEEANDEIVDDEIINPPSDDQDAEGEKGPKQKNTATPDSRTDNGVG